MTATLDTTIPTVTLTPDRGTSRPGHFGSPTVIVTPSRYGRRGAMRFGVGYVSAEGEARREHGGPLTPGPYAYLVPLPTVLSAHGMGTSDEVRRNREAGEEHDVPTGGLVRVDDRVYRVVDDRPMAYPRLAPVDPTAVVREERNLLGQLLSVTLLDAEGETCGRVEYDPATARPTWVNLRDDLAAARDDLVAIRDEVLA